MEALIRYIARTIGRDPAIVALPDIVGAMIARAGFLPGAPINQDQWRMLQRDNIVGDQEDGLKAMGADPYPARRGRARLAGPLSPPGPVRAARGRPGLTARG